MSRLEPRSTRCRCTSRFRSILLQCALDLLHPVVLQGQPYMLWYVDHARAWHLSMLCSPWGGPGHAFFEGSRCRGWSRDLPAAAARHASDLYYYNAPWTCYALWYYKANPTCYGMSTTRVLGIFPCSAPLGEARVTHFSRVVDVAAGAEIYPLPLHVTLPIYTTTMRPGPATPCGTTRPTLHAMVCRPRACLASFHALLPLGRPGSRIFRG